MHTLSLHDALPISKADNVPISWYSNVYWFSLILSSILSGIMITVVLMLYSTVTNIIHIVGLKNDHRLITKEKEKRAS